MDLNGADYALLAAVVVSMGVGLWRGLIVEVLSLTVWVAAFWLAMSFGAELGERFAPVESGAARLFLGYACVFLGTLILGGLVIWVIDKLISGSGLSSTDRLLGLLFGLLRGYVLVCTVVLGLGFTPLPKERWWQESQLMPLFAGGAKWLRQWLPDSAAAHNHL